MSTGVGVLAAGFSRRLGRPKQDIVLAGETLLARAVRVAREAGVGPVAVVLRASAWAYDGLPRDIAILLNEHVEEGMATSVVLATQWARQAGLGGLILMTCDQPLLRPEHLRLLCAEAGRLTASRYRGLNAVPAYFPAARWPALLALRGDAGARKLLADAAAIEDERLSLDIDTEDDLGRLQAIFAGE